MSEWKIEVVYGKITEFHSAPCLRKADCKAQFLMVSKNADYVLIKNQKGILVMEYRRKNEV